MAAFTSSFRNHVALIFVATAMALCSYASVFAQSTPSPMPTPDETGISNNGLHFSIYGKSGDPILAIHGLGASMYTWREFLKEPQPFKDYQLILIDLKGAGDSPKPYDNNYSILTQRDLVLQFITDRKLKNLTLIGNSYGGAVALLLAIELCKHNNGVLSKLILLIAVVTIYASLSILRFCERRSSAGWQFIFYRRRNRPKKSCETRTTIGARLRNRRLWNMLGRLGCPVGVMHY